ncbi:MAG: UDP-N-acetylenolpyruvoylglucosamine reductase, partial [Fusobacteriaceae bacterium]
MVRPPMVYGEGVKGNMLSLIRLVEKVPVLPFNYSENRRTVVGIENLLYMTKLIIDKSADGIYLGSDGESVSIKKIVETIGNGLGKKRTLVKFPTLIFNIMCKCKEGIMVRLFGTLAFKQEDGYSKIGYKPLMSMKKEIERMITSYREGI